MEEEDEDPRKPFLEDAEDTDIEEEEEELTEQEQGLAADEPSQHFGNLIDFALAMNHIQPDNFNATKTAKDLKEFGLPVPEDTEWITFMSAGDTPNFLKGVAVLRHFLERHVDEIDRRELTKILTGYTKPDEIDRTKKGFENWYLPDDKVKEFFKTTVPQFKHNLPFKPKPVVGKKRRVSFQEDQRPSKRPRQETDAEETKRKRTARALRNLGTSEAYKTQPRLGRRSQTIRKQQDALVEAVRPRIPQQVKQIQVKDAPREIEIVQGSQFLQKDDLLLLAKFLAEDPMELGAKWRKRGEEIIDIIIRVKKYYKNAKTTLGTPIGAFEKWDPEKDREELNAMFFSDKDASHMAKGHVKVYNLLKEFKIEEKRYADLEYEEQLAREDMLDLDVAGYKKPFYNPRDRYVKTSAERTRKAVPKVGVQLFEWFTRVK